MNRWIRRIGTASARRPGRTIGVWALLAALVVVLSSTLGGAYLDDFTAPGSDSAAATELLEQRFPEATGGNAVAVFAAPEGERLDAYRDDLESTLVRLRATERVTAVSEPFASGAISTDGRIGFADIVLDAPSGELGPQPAEALAAALAPARDAGLTAEVGGEAVFLNSEPEPSGAEAVGVVVALVVLVVAFGTVVAALVPIALALVAVAAGLGGITLLAAVMDVSTSAPVIAGMVGLGVGIDYALFVVSRYRENRAAGQENATALSAAMGTSGTAVFFAGATVVLAMAALVLTGTGVLASIGLATSLVVLFAVATALSLLPALLSLLGDRIDAGRVVGRRRAARPVEASAWWRLSHRISARPWPYLVVASVLLLTLAAPALSMRTGFPDAGDEPVSTTHRQAHDLLAEGFGPGINAPLLVVADLSGPGLSADDVPLLAERIGDDPGIGSVAEATFSTDGATAVLAALPTTAPADPATAATLERIRDAAPDGVHVTGQAALAIDLTTSLNSTLPLLLGSVLAASFVLLVVVFRSVTVALKAVVMNLLSIGAAYGVVVAVFQWGWLGGLIGLEGTHLIASPLPAIFFAVLFGLSMDYEVFLVSRVREAYDASGDTVEAVARGLASSARVITCGALIMTAVFLSFVANPNPFVKMIGLGLAVAIALDATLVRMVLVPATMALLGRANWWLPAWLDRLLPVVRVEGDVEAAPAAPARVTVPIG
ncbi:Putative transmembrane multidrug efflux transporter [Modestobacter italicus]|uniref:Transmembrane multidrug efflux transporter n=1 Tax=Modestobacter italicus (strain DSM 44449 / CECT 9708 / BC 501) TaxID=2732864 RepID=I4EX59_MODI5|nr:MMPL family transporter [Modestobacter marinus]CCH87972.1 Putative transmembrane multidrug efflux transporter [Modestobacter marinus]